MRVELWPLLSNDPPEAMIMVMICWLVVTTFTKGLHRCVNTNYEAALTGPGLGQGHG